MAICILLLLVQLTSNVAAAIQPSTPLLYDNDSTGISAICPLWESFDATRNAGQCADISGDPLLCQNSDSLILDCYCATAVGNITEVGHEKKKKKQYLPAASF